MKHLHLVAAVAALALVGATQARATDATRIEPTITPLLVSSAKSADGVAAKPLAQAARLPGPVTTMHMRRAADGSVQTWCTVDHDHLLAHPAVQRARAQERQR